MSTALISFLGRQGRQEDGYRRTKYRFLDGETEETKYFAQALRRRLQPDRIVLLGTSGSMWDVLTEDCEADTDLWATVGEAVDRQAVDQALLDQVAAVVSKAWDCEVRLLRIPFGLDETEQVAILRAMADAAERVERVHLDVTHAFRSLPMLALMAAFYLESVRGLEIAGIYYGMFEARDEEDRAPVVRLDGLMHFGKWLRALNQFDKDGDYGVFASLLEHAGIETAWELERAAYFERTGNPQDAARRVSSVYDALHHIDAASYPAAAMFAPALLERLAWFKKQPLSAKEWALAEEYLERRDYFRAALLALEAALTAELERRRLAPSSYESRREIHDTMREDNDNYRRLNALRNAIAHGTRKPKPGLAKILRDEQALADELRRLFAALRRR